MDRLKKAHEFAKAAHGSQKRKFTGEPYLTHLEETAQTLWEVTDGRANKNEYIAALLHDVVEDTPITLKKVGQEFGLEVMNLVEELTIDQEQKEKEGKKLYLSRKINIMTEKAFTIKLCDRFRNLIGLENRTVPKKFVRWYVKETQYLIDNLNRELTNTQTELLNKINKTLIFLRLNRKI
jgi:GTP pyrophosphokinase